MKLLYKNIERQKEYSINQIKEIVNKTLDENFNEDDTIAILPIDPDNFHSDFDLKVCKRKCNKIRAYDIINPFTKTIRNSKLLSELINRVETKIGIIHSHDFNDVDEVIEFLNNLSLHRMLCEEIDFSLE